MADEKALIPIEEQTVDFYGDKITTALVDVDERTMMYVPIKPISDYLGLAWSGQFERIQRDRILSEVAQLIRITRIKSESQRGRPDNLCLPIEFLNGWLFGITVSKVKPELQEKVLQYQRECYRILWEAFNPQPVSAQDFEETQEGTMALEQIRGMGLAIAHMAEQHLQTERRLNKAAKVFTNFDLRLLI